jgi:SPX domain protein involved in polyphosphate accumulation
MLSERRELKFLADRARARRFLRAIQPFCIEDDHDPGHRGYPVSSLYYDSPALSFAHDKAESVGVRRKVRVRFYSTGATDPTAYLEIKEKLGGVIRKKRVRVARPEDDWDVRHFCGGDDTVSREVGALAVRYRLRPSSWVHYQRRVWLGRFQGPRVRITADFDLRAQRPQLWPADGRRFLSPLLQVLEVKVDGALPRWLHETLKSHELKQTKYSKYTNGLRATLPRPARGFGLPHGSMAGATGEA